MRAISIVALTFLACEQPTKPTEVAVTPHVSAVPTVSAAPVTTASPMEVAGPIPWMADPRAALAEAKQKQRATFIYFHAEWCTACKEIERELDKASVRKTLAQKFVAVKVDMTDDEAPDAIKAKERFHIVGLPTMLVFDKLGHEMGRATEFLDSAKMQKLLASAGD